MKRLRTVLKKHQVPGLIPLGDALDALGRNGDMSQRITDVALVDIVGSAARPLDFDKGFRLINKSSQDRWQGLASAMATGFEPPPVDLVQLGELFFVRDGHHRISVAGALGRRWVTARVQRICTIAYATCCLHASHLPTKAAERRFLERIPLPDELRAALWLDQPAQWARLADSAEAWGLRHALARDHTIDRRDLAAAWWVDEVEPLVTRLRATGVGTDLWDVQLYVTALAIRDRLGVTSWPPDIADHFNSKPGEVTVEPTWTTLDWTGAA